MPIEILDNTLIKYDALSVEAMDKIHICLDLLCKYNYIKKENTLRQTYENNLGIYKIERNEPQMWELVWNHKIMSLFQMEQESGIRGIALAKPKNVNDLSVLNSVIRLMAPDKNSKTPLETWSEYRNDISPWIHEMENYGLIKEEIEWLSHHSAITDGICESQEGLMSLVQEDRLGGNSLTFADKCRKGIAKKQGKLFQECEDIFYENIKKNNCSEKLAHYVWDVLLKVQRGYSFNRSHCLAYSLIALQEMNLAYKYPILFWDCACLISDSGSSDEEDNKASDYAKIAKAIGDITSRGIDVSLVNINTSDYGFKPDIKNNRILYGLKALSNINAETIEKIKVGRPYLGIKDFMARCPLTKKPMFMLIKAGAFDEVETVLDNRKQIMAYYISQVCEPKKKLNLQNWSGLVSHGLVPKELELQIRVYNFTKYIKAHFKVGEYFKLDDTCVQFLEKFIPEAMDKVEAINGNYGIKQKDWDKIYQSQMDVARNWLKNEQEKVLSDYNGLLFKEMWDKYAAGTESAWEMESLCFYHGDHELKNVDMSRYGISNFNDLQSNEIKEYKKYNGRQIPIYKLYMIAGTVLSKNDTKHMVSLLTTTGVVTVKMSADQYAKFKKQVSRVNPDGTKTVVERSWFKRGTLLMFTGYRQEDNFRVKTYSSTPTHQVYKITLEPNGDLNLVHERLTGDGILEEDYEE